MNDGQAEEFYSKKYNMLRGTIKNVDDLQKALKHIHQQEIENKDLIKRLENERDLIQKQLDTAYVEEKYIRYAKDNLPSVIHNFVEK